jgi:hypothetical protein
LSKPLSSGGSSLLGGATLVESLEGWTICVSVPMK